MSIAVKLQNYADNYLELSAKVNDTLIAFENKPIIGPFVASPIKALLGIVCTISALAAALFTGFIAANIALLGCILHSNATTNFARLPANTAAFFALCALQGAGRATYSVCNTLSIGILGYLCLNEKTADTTRYLPPFGDCTDIC